MKDAISSNGQITLATKASAVGTVNVPCDATQKPFNRMRLTHSSSAQTAVSLAASTSAAASPPTAANVPTSDGGIASSLGGFLGTTTGSTLEFAWSEVQNSWAMKFLNGSAFSVVVETWLA